MDDNAKDSPSKDKRFLVARQVTKHTRFVASVPALGLLIASIVLSVGTLVTMCTSSFEFIMGEIDLHQLSIEFVEDADVFLLAVALFILSVGLVNLFISDSIPLPAWLEFKNFDALKELLTGVINVMIGVFFLGHVLKGAQGIDTLWIGLGCAVVIVALSFFMRAVFKSED
ncbi:MAG: YqhA family protein [Eggerthellaceae bacterium]|nr:YqhA family protein [Eggerthellaceae bacterium]